MTREHLYPRIWRTTDQQRCNTITQLDRNAELLVRCAVLLGDAPNSIYEYPLASRHGLEDLNVEHYFASQGRRFVEVFDHHLTQTPVEHIDRAKVITGSDGIDFPTMRIARLLEELSLTATDRTDAEQVAQKWRHAHDDLQLKTDGIYAEKCHEIETLKARLSSENKRITDLLAEKGCLYREVDVLKSELIDAQEAGARFERHWRSTCNSLADRERELMAIRAAAGYPAPSDVGSAAFIAIIRNIADNEKRLTAEVEKLKVHSEKLASAARDQREDLNRQIKELRECNDTQAGTIRKFRNEIADLKAIVGSAGGADKEALIAIGKSLGLKETASLGEIMAAAEREGRLIDRNSELQKWNKNQADAIRKVAKAFGCSPAASLEDIVDLAEHFEEHKACVAKVIESKLKEIKKLSRDKRELAGELAVAREELSATNTRNATQAATIRDYQQKEDAADAHPDAIQDLRRRVEKVERRLGAAFDAASRTNR